MSADTHTHTHTHTHTAINVPELVSPQGTFQYNQYCIMLAATYTLNPANKDNDYY